MKKIYLNLKRFDIPKSFDGISKFERNETYGSTITAGIEKMNLNLPVTIYFQESNLLPALSVAKNVRIGCQSVHFEDVKKGGSFGAFTTFRTAKAMKAINVSDTIIGHCEERKYLSYLLSLGGYNNIWPLFGSANQLLAAMVLISISVFLKVTGRKGWMLYIPMCLMLVVTLTSLGMSIYNIVTAWMTTGTIDFLTSGLQLIVAVLLVALGVLVAFFDFKKLFESKKATA